MTNAHKTIDYYFSVISPWTYFGDQRFQDLVKKHGLKARYHPMFSPELFPATGGTLFKDRAAPRKAYRLVELERWRDYLGIKINITPKHFPTPEAPASRLILAAQDAGENVGPLTHAILRAVWVEERDVNDAATLADIATACGLDASALLAKSEDAAYEKAYHDEIQAAIQKGVFGYPTYVYQDELFWGQDRLDFLARALENA